MCLLCGGYSTRSGGAFLIFSVQDVSAMQVNPVWSQVFPILFSLFWPVRRGVNSVMVGLSARHCPNRNEVPCYSCQSTKRSKVTGVAVRTYLSNG